MPASRRLPVRVGSTARPCARSSPAALSRRSTARGGPGRQLPPFERYLRERLTAFPQLTGRRLLRELREIGYAGGYTASRICCATSGPSQPAGFEVRFETPPGRQAQVDFAHFRAAFDDQPGPSAMVWLFSLVLGHSRMLWGRFVVHQELQTLLRCPCRRFRGVGGVPGRSSTTACALCSAARTLRLGPYRLQPHLVAFARHYGYLPKACRPYRAKTKGKVERPFRYVREDFFLGRRFRNLDDLNVQFRQWLDEVANPRMHATTRRVVTEHFAEERPSLRPLPVGPFQAVLRLERRITREGMVSVDGNLYSVPNTARRRPSRCIARPTRSASSRRAS